MPSLHPPAVEALLTEWESGNPGTPVRAVVARATELGFAATPPGGSGTADHLRLVFTAPTERAITLYVNGLRLTAAGSAARKVAATMPGAVVKSRDVQLPFGAVEPFAALETFRRVATGEIVAPAGPAPVRHDTGQLEFAGPLPAYRSVTPQEAPAGRRPVALACVAAVVLLLVVLGAVTAGGGGALVMLGVAALIAGLAAVVVGRARWAFIASRGGGGIVVAAGVVAVLAGGATLPAAEPASAEAAPAVTSSAPPKPAADTEAATAAAEAALREAETEEAAATATSAAAGLLDDTAATGAVQNAQPTTALAALAAVEVKGRAARTGYDRDLFGAAWTDVDRNGCDTRNDVLARDLTAEMFKPGTRNCVVLAGSLADPYSARVIAFQRGQDTSDAVQIDHVVALSNSWQTGAQGWDVVTRTAFANDQLNLLAVDGPLNMQKGDGDAATWLPPNKGYRCAYVARQVAVKVAYGLWMTPAERNAIATVLSTCPNEPLPGGVVADVPAPKPQSAVVVPAPVPVPVPAPAPPPAPVGSAFANCAAAEAAGAAPLYRGQPGYASKLDRDDDGVACEQ